MENKREPSILKIPQISASSKEVENTVTFVDNQLKTHTCSQCNKAMSFVCRVDLTNTKIAAKRFHFNTFPVLFCFDCMHDDIVYFPEKLTLTNDLKRKPFYNEYLSFDECTNEEQVEEAFVKLGGEPLWIQWEDVPLCTECGNEMQFIVELNANDELDNGVNDFGLFDAGRLYVFGCCNSIHIKFQFH